MRCLLRLLVCAGVAVAVAGCDLAADRQYMNEGAGVDLNSSKLVQATERQNEYVNYICQQADYAPVSGNARLASCVDETGWTSFVRAGMNDIDQRCDAYLTWLESKRRDRAPMFKELAAAGGAAHSILTVSGAATDTLAIVSAAFTLANSTYDNWNSRLLLAINHSTLIDIVYSRQNQFRETIKGRRFDTKPEAIYVLRNYLRICMPTTIEADINTSMTLVQRGDPNAAKDSPVVKIAGLGRPLTSEEKAGSRPRVRPPSTGVFDAIIDPSAAAANFTPSVMTNIQKVMCVPKREQGKLGETTAPLLSIWERYDLTNATPNGKLDDRERRILAAQQQCPVGKGPKNYFEWRTFFRDDGTPRGAKLLIDLLNAAPADVNPDELLRLKDGGRLDPSTATLADARPRIAQVRRDIFKDQLFVKLPNSMSDQVTDDLLTALTKLASQPAPNAPAATPPPLQIVPPAPVQPAPPSGG